MAVGTVLLYLANDEERVRAIVNEPPVSVIVKVLVDLPMRFRV